MRHVCHHLPHANFSSKKRKKHALKHFARQTTQKEHFLSFNFFWFYFFILCWNWHSFQFQIQSHNYMRVFIALQFKSVWWWYHATDNACGNSKLPLLTCQSTSFWIESHSGFFEGSFYFITFWLPHQMLQLLTREPLSDMLKNVLIFA